MSRFEENKKILSYAPNYYKIINEDFEETDLVTGKLIQVYSKFIFSVDLNDKEMLKEVEKINISMSKYFSNADFKRELRKAIVEMKVSKKVNDVLLYIVKCINITYDKYLESYTRNLYIPRWI